MGRAYSQFMDGTTAAIVAITFLWLGMVLAISFLEAPLKFQTPGLDLATGLSIGRIVFRALNTVETFLAIAIIILVSVGHPGTAGRWLLIAAVVVLAIQLVAVRPALSRRSDAVLAGEGGDKRSHAHLVYVGFELVKVGLLLAGGIVLLA